LSIIYNLVDKHLQESSISVYRNSKSYTPHITIGRVKGPFDKKILYEIDKNREQDFGRFQVDNVVLYQSTLMREGPKYSPIKIFEI
jgi:2'-5' RNA ligase